MLVVKDSDVGMKQARHGKCPRPFRLSTRFETFLRLRCNPHVPEKSVSTTSHKCIASSPRDGRVSVFTSRRSVRLNVVKAERNHLKGPEMAGRRRQPGISSDYLVSDMKYVRQQVTLVPREVRSIPLVYRIPSKKKRRSREGRIDPIYRTPEFSLDINHSFTRGNLQNHSPSLKCYPPSCSLARRGVFMNNRRFRIPPTE